MHSTAASNAASAANAVQQSASNRTYVFAFVLDNIFAAFVGAALSYVFPFESASEHIALGDAIIYDASCTIFCAALSYGAVRLWNYYAARHSESTAYSARVSEYFLKLVSRALSFSISSAHLQAVEYSWYEIQYSVTRGEEGIGDCLSEYAWVQWLGAMLFALAVTPFIYAISFYLLGKAFDAQSPYTKFILRMLADSYAVSLGWVWYNMIDISFLCQAPTAYHTFWGQFLRVLVLTVAGYIIITATVPRDIQDAPLKEAQRYYFIRTAVYVCITLAFIGTYYYPVLHDTSGATRYCLLFGIALFLTILSIYLACKFGWEASDRSIERYRKFFISLCGWVCCYAWWYPFSLVLAELLFHDRSKYGDTVEGQVIGAIVLVVLIALLTACLSATLFVMVIKEDPGQSDVLDFLPTFQDNAQEDPRLLAAEARGARHGHRRHNHTDSDEEDETYPIMGYDRSSEMVM